MYARILWIFLKLHVKCMCWIKGSDYDGMYIVCVWNLICSSLCLLSEKQTVLKYMNYSICCWASALSKPTSVGWCWVALDTVPQRCMYGLKWCWRVLKDFHNTSYDAERFCNSLPEMQNWPIPKLASNDIVNGICISPCQSAFFWVLIGINI